MKVKALTITTEILLLVIVFVMFILAILGERQYVRIRNAYNIIFFNNNLTYIEDIKKSRVKCLHGYKPILSREMFLGIDGGCYNKQKNKYYRHKECETNNKQIEIEVPPFEVNRFKVFKDKLICIKRFGAKYSKLNFIHIPFNETCPDNYKTCGFFNEFYDKLCTKDKCPITYFEIVKEKDHESEKKYISLRDDTYIAFSNNTQNPFSFIPLAFTL